MSGHIIPNDAPQIPVLERLVKPHPLVRKLMEAAKPLAKNQWGWPVPRRGIRPLEVSRQQLPRALRIVQAIINEATVRGYAVDESAPNQRGLTEFVLAIRKVRFAIRIKEKSGVLTLTLPDTYQGQRNWSDGKNARLEHKLGLVLLALEQRAEEAEERARIRALEEEELRRKKQTAVEGAKERFHADQLALQLYRQVESWRLASEIRTFVDAARQRELSAGEVEWIDWAERHAERVDPLLGDLNVPETKEPTHEDLRPYLGWEPWGFL